MRKKLLWLFAAGLVWSGFAGELKNEFGSVRCDNPEEGIVFYDPSGTVITGWRGFTQGNPKTILRFAELDPKTGTLKLKMEEAGKIKEISAKCRLDGANFKVDFHLVMDGGGLPWGYLTLAGRIDKSMSKVGKWVRHYPEAGGETYLARDAYLIRLNGYHNKGWQKSSKTHAVWLKINDGYRPTHIRGTVKDNPADKKQKIMDFSYDFTLAPSEYSPGEAAALRRNAAFFVEAKTDRLYNIFEGGEAPEVKILVRRTILSADGWKLHVKAYDWDGKVVLDRVEPVKNVAEAQTFRYSLPASSQNAIYFVDASVRKDGREHFSRANIAVIPKHTLRHPEKSIAGISRFFDLPTRKDALELMKRLNVRLIRDGDNNELEKYGFVSFSHLQMPKRTWRLYDPAKDAGHVRQEIDRVLKCRAPVAIFGNEVAWKAPPEIKKRDLNIYRSWIKAFHEELSRRESKVRLSSFATTNENDVRKMLKEYDIDKYVDIIDLHPGRGCWTPDKAYIYWGYLELIYRWQNSLAEAGINGKSLIMTEAYSCTHPHNGFRDSFRQSADNMLLTLVIAYAQKAEGVFIYQLHEGTTWDQGALDPEVGQPGRNEENAYGMLHADLSPKPSLLGYQTATKHLDGVKIIQEGKVPGTKVHVYEFDTDRGLLHVMMDRTDGDQLNSINIHPTLKVKEKNGKMVPVVMHKEPWLQYWKTFKKHTFAASGNRVRVVDAIGREQEVPVRNGKVELTLSGAPVIVYGLKSPFPARSEVKNDTGRMLFEQGCMKIFDNNGHLIFRDFARTIRLSGRMNAVSAKKTAPDTIVVSYAKPETPEKTEVLSTWRFTPGKITVRYEYDKAIRNARNYLPVEIWPAAGTKWPVRTESQNIMEQKWQFYKHQTYTIRYRGARSNGPWLDLEQLPDGDSRIQAELEIEMTKNGEIGK